MKQLPGKMLGSDFFNPTTASYIMLNTIGNVKNRLLFTIDYLFNKMSVS